MKDKRANLFIFIGLLSVASLSALENVPVKEGGDRVSFFADFLYWKGDNLGFSYAFNQTSDTTTFPNVGKIVQMDSDWAPGFQVGLGVNTHHFGWDLLSKWTWYLNESKNLSK